MRQARSELVRDVERATFALVLISGRRELQLSLDLMQQYSQRCVELVADEVVNSLFSEIGQPEMSRKQRRKEPIDNFVERFARWHLDDRAIAPAFTLRIFRVTRAARRRSCRKSHRAPAEPLLP